MSKFLETALSGVADETVVTDDVVVTDDAVVDDVVVDDVVVDDTVVVDDAVVTDDVVDDVVVDTKKKVIVDLDTYLQTNQELVLQVLREKSTDYSAMSNEDALRLKLSKENPEWSAEDVADELSERFGVGLQKITIDKEAMDADEIKEAESHNRKVDAATRLLKKEGSLAKAELAEAVKDLKLPELEYEVEAETPDVDAALAEHLRLGEEAIQKSRDEVWVPALNEAFKAVDKISEKVEYEADGVAIALDVDLALTPEDKASIVADLATYQATEKDSKYLDAQGNVDYGSFVKDKSEVLVRKKMYAAIAKSAHEKGKQDFIRNDVVNFSNGVRNTATPSTDTTDPAMAIWQNNKKK